MRPSLPDGRQATIWLPMVDRWTRSSGRSPTQPPPAARPPERPQRPDPSRAVRRAGHGPPVGQQAPRGAGGGRPGDHRATRPGEAALPQRRADQRHRRTLDQPLRPAAGSTRWPTSREHWRTPRMDKPAFVYTTYIHTTPERLWQALDRPRVHPALLGAPPRDRLEGRDRRWRGTARRRRIADPEQVVLESDPFGGSRTPGTPSPRSGPTRSGFSDELHGRSSPASGARW